MTLVRDHVILVTMTREITLKLNIATNQSIFQLNWNPTKEL